jgi:adhesin transport system outer membrane protein
MKQKSLFNYKHIVTSSISCLFICNINLEALSLKQSVLEVLNTNPIVTERLKNYRSTQQDLNIAESKYLPKIDYRSSFSYNDAGKLIDDIDTQHYHAYKNSLKLTQNIFDGFHTTYQVDYEEARILAAAYNYLEKSNDIAFKMVNVYLNVLKNHEILQNAKDNVDMNKKILKDIKQLYKAGMATKSDLIKVQASLSMAQTNLITNINNTRDAEFNFTRVLGRKPIVSTMSLPTLKISMPESIQRATMYAIKYNPSLLVSQYNVEGAQALYKRDKHNYYPKLDFELEQKYDNAYSKNNDFDSPDDRTIARVVLRWNLYNGGADNALVQKRLSKIHQEIAIKRDLKRQTIEGLELSWSSYSIVLQQMKQLKIYTQYIDETLESLKEEYSMGKKSKKTILDLLRASSDVINVKSRMITARYDILFAQYRILDAMGLMVTVIAGGEQEYRARVNLDVPKVKEVLDTLPISLDVDHDQIADDLDICDNSISKDNIMPFGCQSTKKDSDFDGIEDKLDKCPNTKFLDSVDKFGCSVKDIKKVGDKK